MRFATLNDGSRDGRLAVVSIDHARALLVEGVATLQVLLDDWDHLIPVCRAAQQRVEAGQGKLSIRLPRWHHCHAPGNGWTGPPSRRTAN
ncbi:hypothetical protein [Sphingomonas aerolata]|uniref:hypothetical protein n=1 Tax=Sphingomonas aerolata TaxID=185951 RepID=UPI002FE14C2F